MAKRRAASRAMKRFIFLALAALVRSRPMPRPTRRAPFV